MRKLFVFNPEHDYALSQKEGFSNFRKGIVALSKKLELVPLIWAEDEDFILKKDDVIVCVQDIAKPVPLHQALEIIKEIEPWGWDSPVKNRLKNSGFSDSLLAVDERIKNIKRLSHRRISILLNRELGFGVLPEEFDNVDDAFQFMIKNPGCYFKAPWSSGGRGVINSSLISPKRVEEWLRGIIRQQGSVLAECFQTKKLEFASLWLVQNNKAICRGFSLSESYPNGSHCANLCGAQKEIEHYIRNLSVKNIDNVIESQNEFLNKYIAPFYTGRLGIDMFITESGDIVPGVELNLRNTFGHVAMDYYEKLARENGAKWKPDTFGLLKPFNI